MSRRGTIKSAERKVDRFIERHGLDLNDDQRDEMLHMIESLLTNRNRVIKHKTKRIRQLIAEGRLEINQKHLNAINYGLKQTISRYGPITSQRIGSASKRILAMMLTTENISDEDIENAI